MKTMLMVPLLLSTTLVLGACANNAETGAPTASTTASTNAAVAAPTPASTDAASATMADATPAAADGMAGMSAQEHAAMDAATDPHGDAHAASDAAAKGANRMGTRMQAGWYSAGTFRACGSTKAMKVDNTADIDAQIKQGGMSAGDPVYVQVEGMPMGASYMLTRVVQVGSKTPVRDCPMTGTTTQVGG